MSYFQEKRAITRITLPSDPECWVDVYSELTWYEEKLVTMHQLADGTLPADALLKSLIVDWNLTDEDGEKAPIDQTHLDLLRREDVVAINNQYSKAFAILGDAEAKKVSPNASPKLSAAPKKTSQSS